MLKGTLILLVSGALTLSADSVVVDWDNAMQDAIRSKAIKQPTIVSRALAVAHTAMYDAWAAYDENAVGTRLGRSLRRPPEERTLANKNKAVSYAAYRALSDLFPDRVAVFDALIAKYGYNIADTTKDQTTPAGIGNTAAAAVLAFRHNDGSNQTGDRGGDPYSDYTGYTPVNTPDLVTDIGRWQPLRLPDGTVQECVTPHWGLVIPFALESGSQFRPPPPSSPDSYNFVQESQDLIDIMAKFTDEQKMIVEYWGDNPPTALPPGHWMDITQFVSHRDGFGIDQDAKLFFAVSNALMDAGIACWEAKIFYDYVRPITAIRQLFAGRQIVTWGGPFRGTQTIDGSTFFPFQRPSNTTPPFQEYVSGHSVFSASAATILRFYTSHDTYGGSVTIPAGNSRVEALGERPADAAYPMVPATDVMLSWPTFSAAADQAGMSRRYGGIHFEEGDLNSRTLGRRIGKEVWQKAEAYFQGSTRLSSKAE